MCRAMQCRYLSATTSVPEVYEHANTSLPPYGVGTGVQALWMPVVAVVAFFMRTS